LVGTDGAFDRRVFLSLRFNLGLANAKTLRNKFQLFGVTYDQVQAALEDLHE
jgi:hypothetical protein